MKGELEYNPVYGSEVEYGLYAESFKSEEDLIFKKNESDYPEVKPARMKSVSITSSDTNLSLDSDMIVHGSEFADLWEAESRSLLAEQGIVEQNLGFLSNGGRVYIDYHSTLEYASPECDSPSEVPIYEMAGDMIVLRAMRSLLYDDKISRFSLNKRSTDHNGNSWGQHENITVPFNKFNQEDIKFIAAFNATRSIYTGAGGYLPRAGRWQFAISPRLALSGTLNNSFRHSAGNKPLVCTDIKTYAKDYRWQQSVGEANMFPWPITMKHATNALLVRTLLAARNIPEIRTEISKFNISRPLSTARKVAFNAYRKGFMLQSLDGEKVSPIDWQRSFSEWALGRLATISELTEGESWAINEIIKTADEFSLNSDKLQDKVEWIARLGHIRTKVGHSALALYQKELGHDFEWSHLGKGEGYKRRLKVAGWGDRIFPKNYYDIENAIISPPKGTRAFIRGNAVFEKIGNVVDWHMISIKGDKFTIGIRDSEYKPIELDEHS